MRGGLSVQDVAGLGAGGGGDARSASADAPGDRAGPSQTHVDDLAGDGEAAEPGLSALAVVTQRELGWEQLWEQARRLGPDPRFDELSDDAVEVALHARAVETSVALARLFEVLAEFVVRGIWADQGCRTPGAWLSWKLGIGASTAPGVGGPLDRSRVGTHHANLAGPAAGAPRAYADPDDDSDDGWELAVRSRPGGLAELRVIGPAEEIYELEARTRRAAQQRLEHDTAARDRSASAEADPVPDVAAGSASAEAEGRTPWPNSAQLARTLASAVIAGTADNAADTTGLDRHTMVLHLPADALADAPAENSANGGVSPPVPVRDASGRIRSLDRRVLRRLACEAGIVPAVLDGSGQPLDVGRRRRQLSAALRRAVLLRDRQSCRFPGCATTRHLHVHHIHHWADGGPTVLGNLITLCAHHHRYLHTCHERGRPFHVDLDPGGRHRFTRDDTELPHAGPSRETAARTAATLAASAPVPHAFAETDHATAAGASAESPGRPGPHAPIEWDGPGHYDLDLAIAVLQQHLDAVLPPSYLLAA